MYKMVKEQAGSIMGHKGKGMTKPRNLLAVSAQFRTSAGAFQNKKAKQNKAGTRKINKSNYQLLEKYI